MSRGGKRPGAGRKRGVPNKLTTDLKTCVLDALAELGGKKYLVEVGNSDKKAFCALLGKALPKDLNLGGGLKLQVNLVRVSAGRTDDQLPAAGTDS